MLGKTESGMGLETESPKGYIKYLLNMGSWPQALFRSFRQEK